MKMSTKLGIKRLIIGTAVAALPPVLLASAPNPADPLPCPPDLRTAHETPGAPALPPPGMLPDSAVEPPWLPRLHRLDLSEAQRDAIFDLMHAQQPGERALEKKAGKSLDALHRLLVSEPFNASAARTLADDYAQAVADLTFNRAQRDARLRALLTLAQRQQLDAPPSAGSRPWPGAHD